MGYTDYMILEAQSPDDMREAVKQALTDGWVLLGGVAVTAVGDEGVFYSQALVK